MLLKIALYLRISKKNEGESIGNQRELLLDEIRNITREQTIEIYEFIDDGYTGVNENRPDFRKMISWIYLGKINCVMVKDFSRFSRDFLILSKYREETFPRLGVRFLSVGDRYDSFDQERGELLSSFHSLLYDYYCKDVSRKVKKALRAKKEEGQYAVAKVPYGYQRVQGIETDELVINQEEAKEVYQVFYLASLGYSLGTIYIYLGERFSKHRIWEILHNPVYCGCHVWNKYKNRTIRKHQGESLSVKEWRIQPSAHQAIVSEKIFFQINQVADWNQWIEKRVVMEKKYKKGRRHYFHHLSKCYLCRKALSMDSKEKKHLICSQCRKISIELEELFQIVLQVLKLIKGVSSYEEQKNFQWEERNLLLHQWLKKIEIGDREEVLIELSCKKS